MLHHRSVICFLQSSNHGLLYTSHVIDSVHAFNQSSVRPCSTLRLPSLLSNHFNSASHDLLSLPSPSPPARLLPPHRLISVPLKSRFLGGTYVTQHQKNEVDVDSDYQYDVRTRDPIQEIIDGVNALVIAALQTSNIDSQLSYTPEIPVGCRMRILLALCMRDSISIRIPRSVRLGFVTLGIDMEIAVSLARLIRG